MKVLVACEESQEVCAAFRAQGHEAYSCDIQECSGGHPEWHIKNDVLRLLNGVKSFGSVFFYTQDGKCHIMPCKWDLIIAHPPCTHLACSGARHFAQKRADGRQQEAIDFFMDIVNAKCDRIAIENPVGIMSTHYRKPDQIIQPYQFGEPSKKTTCLWLKGLPELKPTNIVEPIIKTYVCKNGKTVRFSYDYGGSSKTSSKRRSKTFHGIALAMAEQWGNLT